MTDRPTIPSEIEITPAMVEAGARYLRAYLADDGISYGESQMLAEGVLRASFRGFPRDNQAAHSPSESAER